MNLLPRLHAGPPYEPWPDPRWAVGDLEGLVAAGGDLDPKRLLSAYRHGLFPWFGEHDPILWWCPDPRMVFPDCAPHRSRSLRRVLRQGHFRYSLDLEFDAVIAACAAPRGADAATWIVPAMQDAYRALHRLGHAHSLEVWQGDALVGGLYGIALGRMFFGESMFSLVSDASKAGLAVLCADLRRRGFIAFDAQLPHRHLESLGAVKMPRDEFLELVALHAQPPYTPGAWKLPS